MSVESIFVQLLDNGGVGLHNLRHLRFAGGAEGDGVADDTAALLEGDTAADVDTPVLARGTYRVSTATLTKQLRVRRGAVIQVPAGEVLTLPVPDAGPYRIFDTPASAPGIRFSDAGRVRPEWFGTAAGAGVDGNEAWICMAAAITRDGTTIWLRRGEVYPVGDAIKMDPVNNRAITFDGLCVVLDGGGRLDRTAAADPAMTVLWIGSAQDVVVNAGLGGATGVPAGNAAEVLVLSQCERVQLPASSAADLAGHGIALDRCRFVQWGSLQARGPQRSGVLVDAGRCVEGGNLLVQGAAERAALELTNGCRDVVAGTVVSIASRDGVIVGEHGGAGQSNERIVLPSIFVNGVLPSVSLLAGQEPTAAQIATDRGLVIQGGVFEGTPNQNTDVTVGTLDVYYVLQAGISATRLDRFTVGTLRLRGNRPAAGRGVLLADCGEVMLQNGYLMGWGRMMELLRVEHLILRNLVMSENLAALLLTDCPRVTLQGVHFKDNPVPDFLVHVTGTAGFAMARLDVLDCTGTGNAQSSVRIDLGSTGTVGEVHWRGNRGLSLDVYRPAGYEPVAAYYTDDEAWRPAAVNSATPRVDRSRNWVIQNTAATSLTTFTGAREGMERHIFWNDTFTTAVHNAGAGLTLIGGVNRPPAAGKYSGFVYRAGRWIELYYR